MDISRVIDSIDISLDCIWYVSFAPVSRYIDISVYRCSLMTMEHCHEAGTRSTEVYRAHQYYSVRLFRLLKLPTDNILGVTPRLKSAILPWLYSVRGTIRLGPYRLHDSVFDFVQGWADAHKDSGYTLLNSGNITVHHMHIFLVLNCFTCYIG